MYGVGAKGVCLVADYESELRHPMLDRLLRRSGLSRDDFFFATASEAGLLENIQKKNIKVLVPLGERALLQTIGERDIERWRGRVVEHPHLPNVWVNPVFQPSKLMSRRGDDDESGMRHPPRFHGIWMLDIHKALDVAKHGFKRMEVVYLEDPDPLRLAQFADEYEAALAEDRENTWLSWDIETPYKQKNSDNEEDLEEKEQVYDGVIIRVSFCFKPGYAVSVLWDPRYLPTIIRLLRSKGYMVVWNGRTFDVPVVKVAGHEVLGIILEMLDAYHLFQSDLPKGLEWVSAEATDMLPWKHLSNARPAFYSCADADAALRNALYLKEQLTRHGQWELFLHHVVKLMPILDEAGKRGNYTDPVVRNEIRDRLTALRDALVKEIQQYVPRELFPRTRYERLPEALEGTEDPTGNGSWPSRTPKTPVTATGKDGSTWDIIYELDSVKTCSHCGNIATNKTEHLKGSVKPVFAEDGIDQLLDKKGKPKVTRVKNPCKEAGAVIEEKPWYVPKFFRLEDFNPNSSQQLLAFMRHHNHPVGKDRKDPSKETADALHLKKLSKTYGKKFPIYAMVLEVHKQSKAIGTYTPEADPERFLHTLYVNTPSTWRLGSRKVPYGTQIQNWGKREDEGDGVGNIYAKEAKLQIIARPGRRLVQIDSSAVEAVMQGYYMNDPEYMKLASKSIHAWLAARTLGLEFTPENVKLVKDKHAGLYNRMKTTNYLTNFGGGAFLLWKSFPDQFPRLEDAIAAQDALYGLLPTLKEYHHSVRWEAHTKTYLTTPWGYRHWYYDVFKRNPDGTLGHGKDAKRCVAMKPQNSNAAFQKDNLVLIGESKFGSYLPAIASVHDSSGLDVPVNEVDECVEFISGVFSRPISQMRGLQIGCEVEVGLNWGAYDEKKNLDGMKFVHKVVIDSYDYSVTEGGIAPLAKAA